ncbi:MAG: spondin domain-containing protein [Bacteroidota bacterium]
MRFLLLALALLLVGCDTTDSTPEVPTPEVPLDTTAPVITLLGANPMALDFGEAYVEPGATAQDDTDGDLSAALNIDATDVDALTEGSYSVRYSVTDAAGNEASVTRTVAVGAPPALGVASYEVTFDATWSAATHPTDFPSNAHFSRLVGAAHRPTDALFEVGGLASDGIKDMAERGANSALQAEVEALDGLDFLSGPILNDSPDSGTMTLTADGDAGHTALTLVSMVAPSPDWFIGIDRFTLVDGFAWIDEAKVELVVYDAGTDGGQSYRAANAATNPREAIAESDHAYFADDRRFIGTLTIRRLP